MELKPPESSGFRLPGSRRKLIVGICLAVLAVCLAVRIAVPMIWPEDNYPVQRVRDTPVYKPYAHVYEPLDTQSPEQLSVLGFSPVPATVPGGYSLKNAELIEDQDAFSTVDARAVRLYYENGENPKQKFFVMVSAGDSLLVEAEKDVLNKPQSYSNQGQTRWAVFADTDVIVYEIRTSDQLFVRMPLVGREWLICFTGMSRRDVRLTLTALIEQYSENPS